MKYNYINISQFIVLALLFFSHKGFGQNEHLQTINTTGNDISGNSGSVAYSIGQVFYSYSGNNTYQINEGIQQGLLIEAEENTDNEDSDIPDVTSPDIHIVVYPNPTIDYVTLTSDGFEFDNQLNSYQLYNYQGKLLKQNYIQQTNTQIDLTNLSSSIYILQVFVEEKLWKTFKILKK